MILRCINNNLCDSLTLNKEYYVIEETSDYYVVIDDSQNETTCKNLDLQLLKTMTYLRNVRQLLMN